MKKHITANANQVEKLLAYFGDQLNVYCSVAHEGIWIEPGEQAPVKIVWRRTGEVWEREYDFLRNKEYFNKKFVVIIEQQNPVHFEQVLNQVKNAMKTP